MIKILAVRWLGTKLMQIIKETTKSDESWLAVSWERRSQYNPFPPQIEYCTGGLVRSLRERLEYYTPMPKKGNLKVDIRRRATRGVHFLEALRAAQSASTLQICFMRRLCIGMGSRP